MHVSKERIELMHQSFRDRVLVLDGAMGTKIQQKKLTAEDFGGELYEGCNENLVLTAPSVIQEIHEEYLRAGCDIVETNTFGGTPLVLDEYKLKHQARAINQAAAKIAKEAALRYSKSKPRFVAGSMGPTTKAISVTGGVTFSELIENFYHQAVGLYEGGCDYFLIETCQDTRNIKAAVLGIQQFIKEVDLPIPIAVSGTIEPMGTMLAGQSVEALYASLSHLDLLYLGLNCATGPEFMTDPIRTLAELSKFRVGCVPNAGLPDENGLYLETPAMMVSVLRRFLEHNWVQVIGGCCGTTENHVAAFSELAAQFKPHKKDPKRRSFLSGIDYLEVVPEERPYIVGERTNVIGSKKFKDLILENKFDDASEIGKAQVKKGAHIIDVCLANPDRDELSDMECFLDQLIKKIKAPLMIDSTDEKVVASALTYSQGKAIINSINLEDGEERFEKIIPLAKQFGAAVVVGTIDEDPEQGMGVTRQRKLEIAKRSYELLSKKYTYPTEDIYFDPLVFPVGTGDENYKYSAIETIEGIRLIKTTFPETKTVLGISNVSFGLPNSGREVLNSVFLYHCVQSGLDLAIVNSEKLVRYSQITEEEKQLSEDLLFQRHPEALSRFADYFRKQKKKAAAPKSNLTLEERLARYIVEGAKDGLIPDLEEALKSKPPLEIINGPLMKGMDEVGKLFNENKLIVAEVLQSAEVMKTAVGFLEPFMEKKENALRGKVVLATVKGDVHDIGKNLVDIILSNNGFQVINLGIKIPPEQLIQAVESHKPDIIGLSGLLVKSAQQMVVTAEDFARAGINTPILVGGAALTSNFVDKQIAKAYSTGFVTYASDAMHGLDLAKQIVSEDQFKSLRAAVDLQREKLANNAARVAVDTHEEVTPSRSNVQPAKEIPQPFDYARHELKGVHPVETVWPFINPMMLYGRHLGLPGELVRLISNDFSKSHQALLSKDPKAAQLLETVESVKEKYKKFLTTRAVFQFFRVTSKETELTLWDKDKNVLERFMFPRQKKSPYLCLSDYVSEEIARGDNLGIFAVTAGERIRELAEELKQKGAYLESHVLQALTIETAEAYAEFLHSYLRKVWGFPDPPEMTMLQRFQARYKGKRYSFGYPACPDLSDQKKLFRLLNPETIGIHLTEEDMMEPEASVSALVFHHEQCQYFSVGQGI